MKPYSNDLRGKLVEIDEQTEQSQRHVADLCGVSPATVRNLVRRKRETGSTAAFPHAGGRRPALNARARQTVAHLLTERHDATLAEIGQRVERKHRKTVSLATISRWRQRLGLPRKKSRFPLRNETLPASSQCAPTPSAR